MIPELLQQTGLSLDRLQSFCLVAEAGGVTKAARGDVTKQSLFSRQVKDLEEFFGTELIRRKGRGIALTETGRRLHLIARESLTSLSDFKHDCQGQPIEIVIGAGDSIIQWLLMPRIDELRKQLPQARLKFLNLPTAEAVKRLADGLIDFAIVRKDAAARPLQSARLGTMGYSLFLPASLRAKSTRAAPGFKLVDGLPLATLEGEGRFRTELAHLAAKQHVQLNIQVECSSFPLVARAVVGGSVAAILPSIAVAELRSAGTEEIPLAFLKPFTRETVLATNPRLLRIRPALEEAADSLAHLCRF